MLTAVHFVIAAAIAVLVFAGIRLRRNMPVRLKSIDELRCLFEVTKWASARLNIDVADRRLLQANSLWMYRGLTLPTLVRLPREELIVLAPFIDDAIAGNGPPLNLPPEYEDYRPRVLASFKTRMQAEGLWPCDKEVSGSGPENAISVHFGEFR